VDNFVRFKTIFDPSLPPSYSIYGSLSDLRTLLSFNSPLRFRLPILSSFIYDFGSFDTSLPSPLFNFKPSNFCGCYSSYRGSGIYFDLQFPLPIFESPPTSSKTSNICITAVIAEVLAQIFRIILGALVGAFSRYFEWCFRYDSYDMAERVFPYTLGIFSIKERVSLYFGHDLVLKESVSLYFGHV
jgi:hypothetical protein